MIVRFRRTKIAYFSHVNESRHHILYMGRYFLPFRRPGSVTTQPESPEPPAFPSFRLPARFRGRATSRRPFLRITAPRRRKFQRIFPADLHFFAGRFAGTEKFTYFCNRNGGLAQLARALAWHARGHEFESRILHYNNQGFTGFCEPLIFYVYTLFAPDLEIRRPTAQKDKAPVNRRLQGPAYTIAPRPASTSCRPAAARIRRRLPSAIRPPGHRPDCPRGSSPGRKPRCRTAAGLPAP